MTHECACLGSCKFPCGLRGSIAVAPLDSLARYAAVEVGVDDTQNRYSTGTYRGANHSRKGTSQARGVFQRLALEPRAYRS